MTLLMEGKAGRVTAAGSGIGRGSALAFSKAGAKVMVSDVDEDSGKETVRLMEENGGEASFFKCDVSDEDQVIALIKETVSAFGKLDFAHNNAGINAGQKKIGELDSSDWDKTIKVKLYGACYCIKHEINEMLKNGGGATVSSAFGAGVPGSPNMTPYTASKHAVLGLTKSVALEYGKHGIRINNIAPAATLTPATERWATSSPAQYTPALESLPSGQTSTP